MNKNTARAYSTFRFNVITAIERGDLAALNNQEITLLIPMPMHAARSARRPFIERFITEYPDRAYLFGPLRNYPPRSSNRRTPEELDNLFDEKFVFDKAVLLKNTMKDFNLTVHQANGRLVGTGQGGVDASLTARYGIYIHDGWGVGVRPNLKGSKFCEEVTA